MNAEEKLQDLEDWLLKEYNATLEIWSHSESPAMKSVTFTRMQMIAAVARHLIAGRDDVVPIFDERYVVFQQHINYLRKRVEE